MNVVTNILEISLVFMAVIVAATIIERFLEFISIIIDFIEPYAKLDKLWRKVGAYLQKKFISELKKTEEKNKKQVLLVLKALQSVLLRKKIQQGQPVTIRIDLIRKVIVRVFMSMLGIAIGIFLCSKADLNIFNMINELDVITINVHPVLAIIISGILVGSGTSPIHSIIKYAESKKEHQKRQAEIARLKASLGQ